MRVQAHSQLLSEFELTWATGRTYLKKKQNKTIGTITNNNKETTINNNKISYSVEGIQDLGLGLER